MLSFTKPGIIAGNAITAAGGFALASSGHFDFYLLVATLCGLSLIVASACLFNNCIDRFSDEKMKRTRDRPLAKGVISVNEAIPRGISLLLLGILTLVLFTNLLTVLMALGGFLMYVIVYGIWKRRSAYGTIIGSLAGGIPPVVGYCAVSDGLDVEALLLFLILIFWQMPHFYAIALYRADEYRAASFPVFPNEKGTLKTMVHMLLYIIAFTIASMTLSFLGHCGNKFLIIALFLGCCWLALCIQGFLTYNHVRWARRMFLLSLVVQLVLSLLLFADVRDCGGILSLHKLKNRKFDNAYGGGFESDNHQ